MADELTVIPKEAARRLGVSVDFFRDHVEPAITVIKVGRGQRLKTLVPVTELKKWVERQTRLAS